MGGRPSASTRSNGYYVTSELDVTSKRVDSTRLRVSRKPKKLKTKGLYCGNHQPGIAISTIA